MPVTVMYNSAMHDILLVVRGPPELEPGNLVAGGQLQKGGEGWLVINNLTSRALSH